MDLSLETAESNLEGAETISGAHFGARYASYRNFSRFQEQVQDTDIGMIIWPDGALSEQRNNRFGFEHHGLYDTAGTNRPGLAEIFETANDLGMGVSVVLPTTRYQDDPDALREGAEAFFHDLYGGDFGPLPEKLIFEIGNEFYWSFDGQNTVEMAQDYAAIVNAYSDVIQDIEHIYDVDPDRVEISVQIARDTDANEALISNLSDASLQTTDLLSTHSFNVNIDYAGHQIDEIQDAKALWDQASEGLDGTDPGIYLSAYNAASLTRKEAAKKFIDSDENDAGLTLADLDLDGRTTQKFEEFYQNQLSLRATGMEHGDALLQIFSEYQAVGVEAAGVYGWDMVHASRSSFRGTDGEDYTFVGGEVQDMMAESLGGTRALDWYQDNDHSDPEEASVYGFDSADKLVIFIAAPDFEGDDYSLSLDTSGLGDVRQVWGQSLTGRVPENWQSLFKVTAAPGVDQSAEAESYTLGVRTDFVPETEDGAIDLTFTEPGQIIRLAFARSQAGEADIAGWSNGPGLDLVADIPGLPGDVAPDPLEDLPLVDPTPTVDPLVGLPVIDGPEGVDDGEDAWDTPTDDEDDTDWLEGFLEGFLVPFSFFGA